MKTWNYEILFGCNVKYELIAATLDGLASDPDDTRVTRRGKGTRTLEREHEGLGGTGNLAEGVVDDGDTFWRDVAEEFHGEMDEIRIDPSHRVGRRAQRRDRLRNGITDLGRKVERHKES